MGKELTSRLYRFTWTIAEHGVAPENGERFLEGFLATHPEVGPVVSQNVETGELSVTFSLEADDMKSAVSHGIDIFAEGAVASGLAPTEVVDLNASLATDSRDEALELLPA